MGYFLPTAPFCDPIPRTPPQTRVGCRLPDPLHRPPTIVALPSSNASKNHLCTVSAWNMMSLHGDWKTCEMIIGKKPATRGPRATPWKSILKPCRAPFIDFIYIYICVCVCVDHLHRCKTSFGCSGFSTLCLQGVAADHLGPLPTKTPIWSGDTDWDANLRTCTNFHFRQWRPAKPSTGMSFGFFHFPFWIMLHLNLLQNFGVNRFHPLYGFRNLNYCWLR